MLHDIKAQAIHWLGAAVLVLLAVGCATSEKPKTPTRAQEATPASHPAQPAKPAVAPAAPQIPAPPNVSSTPKRPAPAAPAKQPPQAPIRFSDADIKDLPPDTTPLTTPSTAPAQPAAASEASRPGAEATRKPVLRNGYIDYKMETPIVRGYAAIIRCKIVNRSRYTLARLRISVSISGKGGHGALSNYAVLTSLPPDAEGLIQFNITSKTEFGSLRTDECRLNLEEAMVEFDGRQVDATANYSLNERGLL